MQKQNLTNSIKNFDLMERTKAKKIAELKKKIEKSGIEIREAVLALILVGFMKI